MAHSPADSLNRSLKFNSSLSLVYILGFSEITKIKLYQTCLLSDTSARQRDPNVTLKQNSTVRALMFLRQHTFVKSRSDVCFLPLSRLLFLSPSRLILAENNLTSTVRAKSVFHQTLNPPDENPVDKSSIFFSHLTRSQSVNKLNKKNKNKQFTCKKKLKTDHLS